MRLLQVYERCSGRQISIEKCSFYIGPRAAHRATQIVRVTGMQQKDFLIRYLGVPIFAGRSKLIYFEHLVIKVRHKLEGWQARLLSFAGRLTLLQVVLTSIPIYTLASSAVPITKRLERLMCNILLHTQREKRVHWISWDSICRSTQRRRRFEN